MEKVTIREQQVRDAKRFFEILNSPGLKDFGVRPKTIKDEIVFFKGETKRRKDNLAYDYTILYGKEIIGGIGFKVDQHRKYIAEIGYFVDENYWGRGIATKAVELIEKEGFGKYGLHRIEIRMSPNNPASEKVAIKAGYKKEGLLKESHQEVGGKFRDSYLYAKIG